MINGQCLTDFVYYCNVSTAISKSSSGTIKKMLKTANKQSKHHKIQIYDNQLKCQNLSINQGYNVFTFQVPNYISVIPCIHQPGKRFGHTASIVLFTDPLKLLFQCSTK